MKRIISSLLVLLVLFAALAAPVFAADESRTFEFALTVDGSTEKHASTGDVITVAFTLRRTDATEDYTMYALQDEILYDADFFELVEGSAMVSGGIQTNDLGLRDGSRAFYMNYVSLSGGDTWKASVLVGTFQLKVKGTAGASVIRSSNNFVSTADGSDHYAATVQDVTVILTGDCLVHFETNGGSELPDQTVAAGDKIKKPDDPTKEGFTLEGWYTDIDLQNKWDFGKDTVSGNLTLYAKWTEGSEHCLWWLWLLLLLLLILILILILWGRRNARLRDEKAQTETRDKR